MRNILNLLINQVFNLSFKFIFHPKVHDILVHLCNFFQAYSCFVKYTQYSIKRDLSVQLQYNWAFVQNLQYYSITGGHLHKSQLQLGVLKTFAVQFNYSWVFAQKAIKVRRLYKICSTIPLKLGVLQRMLYSKVLLVVCTKCSVQKS